MSPEDRVFLEHTWDKLRSIEGLTDQHREAILRREASKLRSPSEAELNDFLRKRNPQRGVS